MEDINLRDDGEINLTLNDSKEFNFYFNQSDMNLKLVDESLNITLDSGQIDLKMFDDGDLNVKLVESGEINVSLEGVSLSGTTSWGAIGGTLSDQTDLQEALDLKFDISDFNTYFDSQFALKDTDDLTEGSSNFYDKTVVLNEGSNVTITGTYPTFTISSTDSGTSNHADLSNLDYASSGHTGFQATLSEGTGIDISGTTISVDMSDFDTDDLTEGTTNLYDKTVTLNEGTGISISGTYPTFTITSDITQYTDEMAQDSVGTILSNEFTYNDITPSIALNYTNISHTDLQDIGSNTHGQIDSHIGNSAIHFEMLNEDDFASDSDTKTATQQSIKVYVDNAVSGENLWDRTGTILSPHTSGDDISVMGKFGVGVITPLYTQHIETTTTATTGYPTQSYESYRVHPTGATGARYIGKRMILGLYGAHAYTDDGHTALFTYSANQTTALVNSLSAAQFRSENLADMGGTSNVAMNNLNGFVSEAFHTSSTSRVTNSTGFTGTVANTKAGELGNAYGALFRVTNYGGGLIGAAVGGRFSITNAYGTLTSAKGFELEALPIIKNNNETRVAIEIAALPTAGAYTGTTIKAIDIKGTSRTAVDGLTIGGDTNLYSSAANILKTDDTLEVDTGFILNSSTSMTSVSTGAADNDKMVTKGYVDDNVSSLWEVDGTETQLKTADEIDMQSKSILNQRAMFLDEITVSDYDADLFGATWMEFPDAASSAGWIDMTDNVLNLHLNNDWLDTSGGGNNGTAYNGTTFTTLSKLGSHAASFDGIDDYVNCGNDNSTDVTDEITISAWIKPIDNTNIQKIVIKSNDASTDWSYGLGISGNGASEKKLNFHIKSGSATWNSLDSTNDLTAGVWTHFVGVYDGTDMRIYVNGVLDSTPLSVTGNVYGQSGKDIFIGTNGNAALPDGQFYNGTMDEVAIFNRVLSPAEILNIYNNQKIGKEGATAGEIIFTDSKEFAGWNGDIWKIF